VWRQSSERSQGVDAKRGDRQLGDFGHPKRFLQPGKFVGFWHFSEVALVAFGGR
jgi:hypothetical protein